MSFRSHLPPLPAPLWSWISLFDENYFLSCWVGHAPAVLRFGGAVAGVIVGEGKGLGLLLRLSDVLLHSPQRVVMNEFILFDFGADGGN